MTLPSTVGLERRAATTNPDELVEILRRDGGLVLEGLVDASGVAQIGSELDPWVQSRQPGFNGEFDDVFYGRNTTRIQGIPSKSRTFVDAILLHPTLLAVADRVLLAHCGDYWMSQAETIFIGPQEPAQELHRDDLNWSYAAEMGIDLQISVLTALGDYDAEVGATRVIPQSHLWPHDRPMNPEDSQPVELEPGDALVYLGSLVHGGGQNSTDDRVRKGLYTAYLLGWLTPEEAPALSVTPELAATLPQRGRELLGWSSIRGNPIDETGAAAALHLWQLDQADVERDNGLFVNR